MSLPVATGLPAMAPAMGVRSSGTGGLHGSRARPWGGC